MYLGSTIIMGSCIYLLYKKYDIFVGSLNRTVFNCENTESLYIEKSIFPTGFHDIDKLILSWIRDDSLFNILTINKYIYSLQDSSFWKNCTSHRYKLVCNYNFFNYKILYSLIKDCQDLTDIIIKSRNNNIYDQIYKLFADNKKCIYSKFDCDDNLLSNKLKMIIRNKKSKFFGGNYDNSKWIEAFNKTNKDLLYGKINSKYYNFYTNIFTIRLTIKFNNDTHLVKIYHNRPMFAFELLYLISNNLHIENIDIIEINPYYNPFYEKFVKEYIK